jgi:hypothetical protein
LVSVDALASLSLTEQPFLNLCIVSSPLSVLGALFGDAVQKTGTRLVYTHFDDSMIEVHNDDLKKFLEFLHFDH